MLSASSRPTGYSRTPRSPAELDDGRPAVGVARGRDDAGRLVERVDDVLALERDRLAVDEHRLGAVDVARRVEHAVARRPSRGPGAMICSAPRREATPRGRGTWPGAWAPTVDGDGPPAAGHDTLAELGEPAFRARQVWEWAARGAAGYDEMTDLPGGAARARWPSACRSRRSSVARRGARARRHGQGAVRHPRRAPGRGGADALPRRPPLAVPVLAVGLPADLHVLRDRPDAFGRNLTASEILDQALHFRRIEAVDHAVFMGMGEPMMNLDNVLAACERLPDIGITHRRTAISTVGWIPGIERLTAGADADPPRAVAARPRRCAALADHAGQRPLPAARRARGVPGASTRPSGGWCSSST